MDGYSYLILQTLPIVSAVALVFCLMGLFFGASKYRTQLSDAEVARESLATELSDLRKGQVAICGELEEARNQLQRLKVGKAEAQSRAVGQHQPGALAPAQSAAESAPKAPVDLGLIYENRPEQVDDLKLVRGIAKVMEQKLNAAGIYTFAQIARWSDAAATEFGVRLAIIGSIDRYNWREQCAKFHQEKSHEPV